MKSESGQGEAKRRYRMVARAEAAEETGRRILDAARRRFSTSPFEQVTLADVAADAGVTAQTVMRRFGSKEALFLAVVQWRSVQIRSGRDRVEPGDPPAAVRNLVDHYERWADDILPLLAQENRHPVVAAAVQSGREHHRSWVARVFEGLVKTSTERTRRLRLAELTAVTDLYTWKVLRRDLGLGREDAERTILDLVTLALAAPDPDRT